MPDSVQRLAAGRASESFLEPHHVEAARRLETTFGRARLRQRVTMSYDPTQIGSRGGSPVQADLADSAADARKRLNTLARKLPADCWGVLVDVCGLDKGLQEVELERNWPRRSAKLVLRIALEQVCAELGISSHAQGRSSAQVEAWLESRPAMFPEDGN